MVGSTIGRCNIVERLGAGSRLKGPSDRAQRHRRPRRDVPSPGIPSSAFLNTLAGSLGHHSRFTAPSRLAATSRNRIPSRLPVTDFLVQVSVTDRTWRARRRRVEFRSAWRVRRQEK